MCGPGIGHGRAAKRYRVEHDGAPGFPRRETAAGALAGQVSEREEFLFGIERILDGVQALTGRTR